MAATDRHKLDAQSAIAYRELDDALGLTALAGALLSDGRRGKNTHHVLAGLLRQSVFGRLAGYEDVNDADRLARDPAMRWIVVGHAVAKQAASASHIGRFETEWLASDENSAALIDLSGQWIDRVHGRRPLKSIVLDMDSSVSPTYGDQEGAAYNGHFACTCDAEASYQTAIGPGGANFRVIGTYYLEISNVVNGIYVDNIGSISTMTPNTREGLPRLKLTRNARYTLDAYSVGLEANLIGSAKLNTYWTDADIAPEENAVPAALYFNFNASYDFEAYGSQSRLYIRVDNVMDKQPPNQGEAGPSLFTGGAPMRGLYDLFGRFYRVGLRMKF